LFVSGGFDQVASLLAHADLDLAHLVDNNLTALEYARMRLALTQISADRFEYVNRLVSRRTKGDFKNIVFSMTPHIESVKRELGGNFYAYRSFLEEGEITYNLELAEETARELGERFAIHGRLLEQTILNRNFENKLDWGENDVIAGRRFWSFLSNNKNHWLSSDNNFEKIKGLYATSKIKFSQIDLGKDNLDSFGDVSLVYSSNIHEWLGIDLFYLLNNLIEHNLSISEKTLFISTSTPARGKGRIIRGFNF